MEMSREAHVDDEDQSLFHPDYYFSQSGNWEAVYGSVRRQKRSAPEIKRCYHRVYRVT